jgi:hypothetical protein
MEALIEVSGMAVGMLELAIHKHLHIPLQIHRIVALLKTTTLLGRFLEYALVAPLTNTEEELLFQATGCTSEYAIKKEVVQHNV